MDQTGDEALQDPEAILLRSRPSISSSNLSLEANYDLISISTIHASRHKSRLSRAAASRDQENNLADSPVPNDNESVGTILLFILRLLQSTKVRSLAIPLAPRFNTRRVLGSGSSFAVEQSWLPIDAARYLHFYRLLDLGSPTDKFHFIDHTGTKWASETEVAYKTLSIKKSAFDEGFDRRRLDDTLVELQVLCHKPLQRHPNIVQLLGVAWLPDEELDTLSDSSQSFISQYPLEWPTIVTERAIHGSLRDFLISETYKQSQASLKAKWNLCLDTLLGIVALHSCGIVHGDIKTANVLVFPSSVSTAENWTAKLSDFGSSLLYTNKTTPDGRLQEEFRGTDYYRPPELDPPASRHLPSDLAKSADIWCWGMLVWAVLVDGFEGYYLDDQGKALKDDDIFRLRSRDELGSVAIRAVENKFVERHQCDHDLANWILEVLRTTLCRDPRTRPSADQILLNMSKFENARGSFYLGRPTSCPLITRPVNPLDDLPFFDLIHHYYNTIHFRSLPPRIFSELQRLKGLGPNVCNHTIVLEAHLQLAFCYGLGYGTEQNRTLAVENLDSAAKNGLQKAMEISLRFLTGLGVKVTSLIEIRGWLQSAMLNGSIIASKDLELNFPNEAIDTREQIIERSRQPIDSLLQTWRHQYLNQAGESLINHETQPLGTFHGSMISDVIKADTSGLLETMLNDVEAYDLYRGIISRPNTSGRPPLLESVKAGDFEVVQLLIDCRINVKQIGPCGETALHWLSIHPTAQVVKIAALLLDTGLDIEQRTYRECQLSNDDHFPFIMPPVSTALEWAIILDNVELVKFFEFRLGTFSRNTDFAWLAYAAENHSYETMKFLCQVLPGERINSFDTRGFSAFYYAIRPDEVSQLQRYSPRPGLTLSARSSKVNIITILLEAGSDMRVRNDDSFGPFHLLATIDDPDIVQILLRGENAKRWIDAPSKFQDHSTALKQAVMKGNIQTMRLLLENGADPSKCENVLNQNWSGRHALHLCCYAPGQVAVSQAEILLAADPSAIRYGSGRYAITALHAASYMGHQDLIKFLLQSGADLLKGSLYLTPLGAAITSRSVTGVRVLCQRYHKANIPLTAGFAKKVRRTYRNNIITNIITRHHIPAITYLLNPGDSSPRDSHMGQISLPGSYDHPFSKTSEIILDILLEYYERLTYRQNPYALINKTEKDFESGLPVAVRLANMKIVEKILATGKFEPDLQELQYIVLAQLVIKGQHVASAVERQRMLEKLVELDEAQYEDRKRIHLSRRSILLRYYWWAKYHYSIDPERRLHSRILEGVKKDLIESTEIRWYSEWFPHLSYFQSNVALPVWWISNTILWVGFLMPTIICLAVYSFDDASQWDHEKTSKLVIAALLILLTPFWPKILTLVSIHCANHVRGKPGKSPIIYLLQLLIVILFATLSVFEIWLLYPGNCNFTPYSGFIDAPSSGLLAPLARNAITHGLRFINGMIAWIVITQVTLQLSAFFLAFASFNSSRRPAINTVGYSPEQWATLQQGGKIIVR